MKSILVFLKKETTIAGVMITCILLLSLLPDIIKWKSTPTGHVYNPIHNNLIDYPLYINFIKQGLDGQTVLYDRFTTEPHRGTWAIPFYLVLGRIGRITGIQNPHTVYHLARVGLGMLFAIVAYWYIRNAISSKTGRLLALFFIVYGASIPRYQWPGDLFSVSPSMSWWSELDPIIRMTFLPAHVMGHILLLLTICCFTRKRLTVWMATVGTCSGFFAGLFHTPSLILPLLLLPAWTLVTGQWKRFTVLLLCLPASALSFIILSKQFSEMPWIAAWDYERLSFAVSLPEYLLALGPIVPFGLLGMIVGNTTVKTRLIWILWVGIGLTALSVTPLLFQGQIAFLRMFPVSNIRFLQISIGIPLSILSVLALLWIWKRFGSVLFSGLVGIIIVLTLIGYPASLRRLTENQFGGPLYQYPTAHYMQAVKELEKGDKTRAILSLPFAGLAIGMNTGRTVYVGRLNYTINISDKTDFAWDIYEGSMPVCTAFDFFVKNRISEVFYGYDEQNAGGDLTGYPFLTLLHDYGDTQIFMFTNEKPPQCQ